MRVCGAGGCGFQAQAVKASDGKRGLLRVSPCSMHCAAQKPRAKQQPGRIALAKYKTPVCACVSLSRDAAHTSGGHGWPASTTLLKKKIATLDGRAPPAEHHHPSSTGYLPEAAKRTGHSYISSR